MTQNHSAFSGTSHAANAAPSSKDLVTVPLKDLVLAPWVPVISMIVETPPANPTEGDTYLVPPNATGWWAAFVGQIVQWHNNEWAQKQPAPGHGISLPDGRIFELVNGTYIEKIALDVQSGKWVYAQDTSAAVNRVVVNPDPAVPALTAGLGLRIKVNNANTGKTMLAVAGYPDTEIVRLDGSMLFDSDLVAGGIHEVVYDGTKFQLLNTFAAPCLSRGVNLYVNVAIGNDANDGTANDAAHAMAQIQAAINRAFSYGPSGQYGVTIHVADGTYDYVTVGLIPPTISPGGPNLSIIGNVTNPSVVVVDGGAEFSAFSVSGQNSVFVSGIRAQTIRSGNLQGFQAFGPAFLSISECETGAVGNVAIQAYVGGQVWMKNHRFAGDSVSMYAASAGGYLSIAGLQTITTPIALDLTCAGANIGGIITANCTFSGEEITAGYRYYAVTNGVIYTNHGGPDYFPGASAGTISTGGQYG